MSVAEYKNKLMPAPRSPRTNADSLRKSVLCVLFSAASVFTAGHAVAAPVGANTDLIGGRQVESLAIRNPDSSVCIVFENGLRGTLDSWSSFGVDNSDPQTIALVKGLYPNATKIVLDSDHQMQKQSPAQVAEAIKNVIAKRASSR